MKESERKKRPCAACGKPVREATIVAGGEFPDAPLCMVCGTRRELEEVYEMIRARRLVVTIPDVLDRIVSTPDGPGRNAAKLARDGSR